VELELQAAEAEAITEELEETNRQLTDALATADVAQSAAAASARERDALQAQLDHAQRMEAIGRLAGGIAHDFNNFLTIIKGHASFMLAELPDAAPMREDVAQVSDAADRAASLTRQLLAFSRRQVLQPRPVLLNETVSRIEALLRRLIGEDIELQTQLSPDLYLINADPGQIEQIVMNLAVNARDAMPNGGRLEIATANAELSEEFAGRHLGAAPGQYVMLTVSDNGTGIPVELRGQIFEPFFTTKEMGKGTGLGLSTVYGIVKQSGGDLWVYSEPGEGTTFKIYLPALVEMPPHPVAPPARPTVATGNETILLVEDEAALRTLTSRILEKYGYRAIVAKDGREALDLVRNGPEPIALVISDVVMPNLGGRMLVQRLRAERPGLPVLLMSGYTDDVVMQRGIAELQIPYLQKPFTPEQLARKIREVLDTARAA
jgi:two-component system, cell cycle sensor histidine kinase and response regulator CckA